ncbi:hypothetical protein SEA_KLEIN_53 [Mycobacterium phage Klein]|nr:hypothetical protein SEA_KLEIN_53 [Mycobacterium phage Klein]
MTNENDYCWCGTRVQYLQTVEQWLCPAHGYQERVYGPTPSRGVLESLRGWAIETLTSNETENSQARANAAEILDLRNAEKAPSSRS